MNLTVLAGILVTLATARKRDGRKPWQAAGEPQEAMREAARPASLVEKMMNKRMEQLATREEGHSTGGLVEKKRQAAGEPYTCIGLFIPCKKGDRCCNGTTCQKRQPYNGTWQCRP